MTRIRKRLASPAMIVAIIALIAALAGTSVAAIGLGELGKKAKNKTVGVGELTYVSTTTALPAANNSFRVAVACPGGLFPVGGGIALSRPQDEFIDDSFPTSTGWAGHVDTSNTPGTATVTVACATSRKVTGAPPIS